MVAVTSVTSTVTSRDAFPVTVTQRDTHTPRRGGVSRMSRRKVVTASQEAI